MSRTASATPDDALPDRGLSLEAWLARLERQHPVAIDLGLERVAVVAERLGLTESPLAGALITVAGTNGKGSTVAMLEALAGAHGRSTAAYTSPHLLRYNERLRLDGREADDGLLVAGFERVEAARLMSEPVSLTYFEVGTLAALWAIAQRRPEVAILEVGLGGRLDAVNVVDSDVAVVTSVALDHADFLGTDLEAIGREKAGILRGSRPAVLGHDLPGSVFAAAEACGAQAWRLGRDFQRIHRPSASAGEGWQWRGVDRHAQALHLDDLPVPGLPLDNAALAIQALALAGIELEPSACRRALAEVTLAGRMQWLDNWCLDVAHNPHAASYLAARLAERSRPARRIALLGMLRDKDAQGIFKALSSQVDAWVTVSLEGPRARSADELAEQLIAHGATLLHRADSPAAGAAWLAERLAADDEALVCGSFYTVAEVLGWHAAQGSRGGAGTAQHGR
ncbi:MULTISPECIES: bifunctional tetrahydrofolate synthase/dihydrofolate synthase [Halomonadaceae]|uniref:Dihydrofolate synthase/folylpolyglutamate synthase n=1 Tax=Modicisalibacter zincidurans TaxID=1178777 RepID=A0ABP9RMR2_9GAMM|nr:MULTISPECIES: bifunctional tetrahydrofolate synthase/dihydrofolate synthase [Halomonas]MCD6009446.1 bifunctional tetrahydrofolate synthase/dihydrofolate synthase [Halomonas sp. IOP_31]